MAQAPPRDIDLRHWNDRPNQPVTPVCRSRFLCLWPLCAMHGQKSAILRLADSHASSGPRFGRVTSDGGMSRGGTGDVEAHRVRSGETTEIDRVRRPEVF